MIPERARYGYVMEKATLFLLKDSGGDMPLNLFSIIKRNGWALKTYTQLAEESGRTVREIAQAFQSNDGFTIYSGRNYTIAYNDLLLPTRIRFTLAHEIGHIFLGHFSDFSETRIYQSDMGWARYRVLECEANSFARNVLSPVAIVMECDVYDARDLQRLFGISSAAASSRLSLLSRDYELCSDENYDRQFYVFSEVISGYFFFRTPVGKRVYKAWLASQNTAEAIL